MNKEQIPVKRDYKPGKIAIAQPSRWRDLGVSLRGFWKEFSQIKYGVAGLILLAIFFLMIVFEPWLIPFPEASERWRDISYWDSNPRNAAPVWVNWFSRQKGATHQYLRDPILEVEEQARFKVIKGTFSYDYRFDLPPTGLSLRGLGKGDLRLTVRLERPDGQEIELYKDSLRRRKEDELKLPLGGLQAASTAFEFGQSYDSAENVKRINRHMIRPYNIFFARAQEGILLKPEPLPGEYKIHLEVVAIGQDAYIKDPYLIVSGRVFGLLGTDNSRRDIWSGVVAGIKWAMFIGLLTAFISVVIGVTYGVTSAYFGGWIDSMMMRIFEVFVSIPILPVLIVLSAVFKPTIWLLIFMMTVFFWTGPVRTVRSIGMQIREETYIEAAYALNASHARIIFKHMVPQLIPYAFATMALAVPRAIIFEASISLLGFGDASIVTWGQILHDAMNGGAILQGLWWWVIPPGLTIALMSMTFAFIGFSMDKILNPKLKTR